jgi:hypothetical protein
MELFYLRTFMTNVVYLHGQPAPIAKFRRVSEHRRLEQLLEARRLPYDDLSLKPVRFSPKSISSKRYGRIGMNSFWIRLDRMRDVLENLEKTNASAPRSPNLPGASKNLANENRL